MTTRLWAFAFTLHVHAAAGEQIELYSGIGYFGWAPTAPKWVDRNLLQSILRGLFVVDVGRISGLAPLGPLLFGPLGINFSVYVIAYDLITAPIRPWLCDSTYNMLNLWMP